MLFVIFGKLTEIKFRGKEHGVDDESDEKRNNWNRQKAQSLLFEHKKKNEIPFVLQIVGRIEYKYS